MHGTRFNCGGTDFNAPTKHANSQKNLDGYIILTDGGAEKPKPSRLKRCYILAPGQKLFFEPDAEDTVIYMKQPPKE
jgi:predicted metal-dependent peptidase